jgi:ArsR family transcriptional regulator
MLNKVCLLRNGESMDIDVISKALANPLRRQILQWLKQPEQFFEGMWWQF